MGWSPESSSNTTSPRRFLDRDTVTAQGFPPCRNTGSVVGRVGALIGCDHRTAIRVGDRPGGHRSVHYQSRKARAKPGGQAVVRILRVWRRAFPARLGLMVAHYAV